PDVCSPDLHRCTCNGIGRRFSGGLHPGAVRECGAFSRRLTMSTQNHSLQRAVRYALLAGAAGAAATALPTQAADQTIQEVVVTGSPPSPPETDATRPTRHTTG